uniref:Laminin G domain-containing protein n=1 Tax=Plectus sambesii TaxID=2011161 RepID=A0A914UQW2_9BILA
MTTVRRVVWWLCLLWAVLSACPVLGIIAVIVTEPMTTVRRVVWWLCLLWAVLLEGHGAVGADLVFQGTCGDTSVPCEQLCVQQTVTTFECGCWNDYELLADGVSCKDPKSRVRVNYAAPTVPPHGVEPEKREGLRFNGSAFAAFDAPDSIYLETNITLEFKFDRTQDGLLLFAGQWDGKDFLAVSLIDGSIVLRFDCGEGTAEDVYGGPFAPNEWHTLSIFRKFCSHTQISINDVKRVLIDDIVELKNYRGISVDKYVYLGGAPNADKLLTRAVVVQGFVGCVRRLIINEMTLLDAPMGVNGVRESDALAVCASGRRAPPSSGDFTTKSTRTTPTSATTSSASFLRLSL